MNEATGEDRRDALAPRSVELLRALTQTLEVLGSGGDETAALTESFESAARAFGAQKALLLGVKTTEPLDLLSIRATGLASDEIDACVRGESIEGVSASRIRRAIETGEAQLVENSQFEDRGSEETGSLRGRPHSVLVAPVLDPWTHGTRALLYFQTGAGAQGYSEYDLPFVRAYATALGHAFGLHFISERRCLALEEDCRRLQRERSSAAPEIIGESEETQRLRDDLWEIFVPVTQTSSPRPILILGETGTGKDLVARFLHHYSSMRAGGPFVEHNCAGLSGELVQSTLFGHTRGAFTGATESTPGLFRAAHKGVLFLDEIGAMPSIGQELLLKVLDRWVVQPVGDTRTYTVDVQLLCATNQDLAVAVREGRFRHDLFQRLKPLTIRLTPLAQRPGDILPLLTYFMAQAEKQLKKRTRGVSPDALGALLSYSWPGNVRELAGVCTAIVTHARPGEALDRAALQRLTPEVFDPEHHVETRFAEEMVQGAFYEARARFEREFIVRRLDLHQWNVPEAARSMGLSTATLYRYLQRLGLKRDAGEP